MSTTLELSAISPPIFNDGRPILTVVTMACHFLDDFSGTSISELRIFQDSTDITPEVAAANALQCLANGSVMAPDLTDLVMAYAQQTLGDATGYDIMLADHIHRHNTINQTHPTLQ